MKNEKNQHVYCKLKWISDMHTAEEANLGGFALVLMGIYPVGYQAHRMHYIAVGGI